jgi:neutral trehalase
MYDDIPFDKATYLMQLADVGLTAMYVMDCEALADIAVALSRTAIAKELRARAETYRAALRTLWDKEAEIFLNRRTDTGQPSQRLSPTNFYALLADAPSEAQARRMIDRRRSGVTGSCPRSRAMIPRIPSRLIGGAASGRR